MRFRIEQLFATVLYETLIAPAISAMLLPLRIRQDLDLARTEAAQKIAALAGIKKGKFLPHFGQEECMTRCVEYVVSDPALANEATGLRVG